MLFHAGNDAAPELTPAYVRDRLAGRAARDGAHAAALTPAAVLLPLVTHPAGLTALFTERTAHLADHAGTGEPSPYVLVRDRLEALIARPVFYPRVELGVDEVIDGDRLYGVWSEGCFFQLGKTQAA